MPWVKLIDNEYITLEYLPEKKILYHTLHQPFTSTAFRECLMAGLETMQKYGVQKWLSDERKNQTIPLEDVEWSIQEWSQHAIAAGWKYWAIIVPDDQAGRELMMRVKEYYRERGIKIMVFLSPKAALEWLEAV